MEIEEVHQGRPRSREAAEVAKNVTHARSRDVMHESERQKQMHRNLSRFSNNKGQLHELFSGVNLLEQNQDINDSAAY